MRKLYYFISAAVIALGLASCNKEETALSPEQPTDRLITFVANTENSVDTKTSLSGNDKSGYRVLWSEGDKIIVNNSAESKFYLQSGAGTTKGTFQGYFAMEEGSYDAYYTTASSIYSLSLPDETEYMAGNIISSAPMKGILTFEGGYVSSEAKFKNLCGLLRLSLQGEGTVKKIRVYAKEYLYGEFEVNEEGSAVINYKPEHDYITQYCREGVDLAPDKGTDFYFPLPPNDYTEVRIEITDVFNNTCTKTLKEGKTLNIARALITPVSLTVSNLGKRSDVPAGSLYGKFTVKDPDGVPNNGDESKVYFSRGNLYWDGDSFELEENQYEVASSWNEKHVSHFYWGWDEKKSYLLNSDIMLEYPRMIFTNNSVETPDKFFTVSNVSGKYRTLSIDEWKYLFGNHSYEVVTVNDVYGCVIAPDGINLAKDKYDYTPDELAVHNLVFLPMTGIRIVNKYAGCETTGYYWSSTDSGNYDKNVFCTRIERDQRPIVSFIENSFDEGRCIRLVTDVITDSTL